MMRPSTLGYAPLVDDALEAELRQEVRYLLRYHCAYPALGNVLEGDLVSAIKFRLNAQVQA